ncbi:CDP-glycerol glycerophosphotransferase family protein, partial [Methanobrevibacter curvatus]|uniref:CDP-glycerol glycerophosphotransferase family protein n=1 Tax=Methanobrevibacter curvatus TaxID=49547 RepID=UPI000B2ACBEB
MKRVGYLIFNFFYYIFYTFFYFIPLKDQIVAIKSHENSDEGNIEQITSFFHEKSPSTQIILIKKEDYNFNFKNNLFKKAINFFIKTPYNLSRSKTIFLDNIFMPFAYTKFKTEVNLVQLWHSSGTIKKFALDSEKGWIKSLAKKSTSKQTHLIIESEGMLPYFKTAFNMEESKIYPIGTPRTDLFFQESYKDQKIKSFYKKFNELKDKKLILYAPTFRDEDFIKDSIKRETSKMNTKNINKKENNKKINNKEINHEIFEILKHLDDEWILILKLHPKVSKNFDLNKNINESIIN